jgi:hypothetical protein
MVTIQHPHGMIDADVDIERRRFECIAVPHRMAINDGREGCCKHSVEYYIIRSILYLCISHLLAYALKK